MMKGIGRFFKRQWKIKTGKGGILGVIGAGLSVATGTMPVAVGLLTAYGAVQTMLLRDGKAKEEDTARNGTK